MRQLTAIVQNSDSARHYAEGPGYDNDDHGAVIRPILNPRRRARG